MEFFESKFVILLEVLMIWLPRQDRTHFVKLPLI